MLLNKENGLNKTPIEFQFYLIKVLLFISFPFDFSFE